MHFLIKLYAFRNGDLISWRFLQTVYLLFLASREDSNPLQCIGPSRPSNIECQQLRASALGPGDKQIHIRDPGSPERVLEGWGASCSPDSSGRPAQRRKMCPSARADSESSLERSCGCFLPCPNAPIISLLFYSSWEKPFNIAKGHGAAESAQQRFIHFIRKQCWADRISARVDKLLVY